MQGAHRDVSIGGRDHQADRYFRGPLGDGNHIDVLAAQRGEHTPGDAGSVDHPRADHRNDDHLLGSPDPVDVLLSQLVAKSMLQRG